jgi:hypothetical protein
MLNLPVSVINFAASNEDRVEGYKKFVEYYDLHKSGKTHDDAGVSFDEMNGKMLDFFKDELKLLSGKDPALYGDMARYANNSQVAEAAFDVVGIMTDLIIPDALIKSYGMIANVVTGAWGDSLKVDVKPRDLFVVSKGTRGKRQFDVTRQYNGQKTVVGEPRVITVGITLYDILTGKASLAEFMSKAIFSIEAQMRYDIYDAFAAAIAATSGSIAPISGFAQATAIARAQLVQAWNAGKPAIFFGTKLALSNVLPASTNYRFDLGSDYVRLGHLRDFFGFDCVEMEQIADYTTEFSVKIDDTKINIISPSASKLLQVFVEGSTLSHVNGNYDNANLMVNGSFVKSYGIGVATSAVASSISL